jgi:hypothetical protein
MSTLQVGDTGTFQELSNAENPDNLIVSYNPPIEAMLERARQLKGKELSEAETERIRNNAPAIALSKEVHEATFRNANK